MKELVLPADRFDLKGFAQAVSKGGQSILQIDDEGPPLLSEDEVNEAISLIRSGHPIFFGFHHSYVGEPVVCADGALLDVPDEEDEKVTPAALALLRRTRLADDGNYGFWVSEKNGQMTIEPAFQVDGGGFDPESDCGLFEERMIAFCQRFIR